MLQTRKCPTHGHVDISCYEEALSEDPHSCPVPTYQEEPCGQELEPRVRTWVERIDRV